MSDVTRVVALMPMSESLATCSTGRRRFLREAQAAAAVHHDHVVMIHAIHEEGPIPYLAMELVESVSLERKLEHREPLSVEEAGNDAVPAIRQAVKRQEFDAPEGTVRIDPATQHTSQTFRVGRITQDGRFEVVYSSESPIAPIPYPSTRSQGEWDAFLMDLHLRWGGWSNSGK